MRALVFLATLVGLAAACDSSLGPPRKRALPVVDGVPALRTPGARSPRLASYAIDARYDAATRRIEGTQVLTWTNGGSSEVDSLPFHLYLNGFKNESSLFMRTSEGSHRGNVASDDGWGWIEVPSIRVGGHELRPQAKYVPVGARCETCADETVLDVPLPTKVQPGETIEVAMTFTSQLPRVFARTGYEGAFVMAGQWFPKIGVRVGAPGAETWHCAHFHAATEFFADFGVYDVKLTVPQTHVVTATGVLTAVADNPDGTRVHTYHAEDVHDFVWMADPYMEVLSGKAKVADGEVIVRVVHRPRQRAFARRHLAAAIGAVEQFSDLFVPYPWSILTVIDPPPEASGAAGMEYPTVVTTAGDHAFMRDGIRLPEFVTIHEIGHNWFQGMLASNEVEEAWLDEGVNEWADGVVMARMYGEKQSGLAWMGWRAESFRLRRALEGDLSRVPSPIATAAYAFVDFDGYASVTYARTAQALRTLENLVGRDRFAAAMKLYTQRWAFKHPTGNDFFTTVQESVGEDLSWFWRPAFYDTGSVDYAVRSASCEPARTPRGVFGEGPSRKVERGGGDGDGKGYICDVVVVNLGVVPVPVEIELRFADQSRHTETWDSRDGSRWTHIRLPRSHPLIEVEIDPDAKVLLASHLLDDHIRLEPDKRASWRAGSRITFWTQGLMQAVAP